MGTPSPATRPGSAASGAETQHRPVPGTSALQLQFQQLQQAAAQFQASSSAAAAGKTPNGGSHAHPSGSAPGTVGAVNGVGANPTAMFPQIPSHYGPPPELVKSGRRPKDQMDSKTYLIPSLTLQTHPSHTPHIPGKPLRLRVPASPSTLHTSVTLTLPAQHHTLHLSPHIPLAGAVPPVPWRIFVSVNGTRVSEAVQRPLGGGGIIGPPVVPGMPIPPPVVVPERDRSRPVYEVRLERGAVARVEVEVLAEGAMPGEMPLKNGGGVNGSGGNGGETRDKEAAVRWEKFTLFLHCLRS